MKIWTNYGSIELVKESALDWQCYSARCGGQPILILGVERYAQLQFAIETQHSILESDPGPLDAMVP